MIRGTPFPHSWSAATGSIHEGHWPVVGLRGDAHLRTKEQTAWLAGLLEGEGCFIFGNTLHISLQMTDRDVVETAHRIMESHGKISTVDYPRLGTKPCYRFCVCGKKAVSVMVDIYPWMGDRRREKIADILLDWYSRPGSSQPRKRCYRGHELTADNVYWLPNGKTKSRVCAICHRARQRAYNARNAEAIAFRRAARKAIAAA